MRTNRRSATRCAAVLIMAVGLSSQGTLAAGTGERGGDAGRVRSVAVRMSDLDLGRDEGLRTAYTRLEAAARRVCGAYDHRDSGARRAWKRCYESALDSAVAAIGAQALIDLHSATAAR